MDTVWELAFRDGIDGNWVVFGYYDTAANAGLRAIQCRLYHYRVRLILV